ncbi:serine-rich adhesin for platelets-like [Mytilus edulis]|uniref:serine-rich adhesin for platelets-like n=1 Tax=Mytilus edulis TaxID=6550 RepID=UPI0039F0C7CF
MADMFHELEEITSFSENSEDIPSIFQQFDLLVNNRNKSKKKENLVEDLRRPGHNHALDKMMLQHLNKRTKPKRKVSSVPLLYIPGETNSSIVTIDQETFRGLVGNPKPKQRQSRKKVRKTHDFEDSKVPLSQTLPFDSETVLQEVETGQMKGKNSPQNEKVECAICGVKFENSLRLKQHSRVHRRCINNGRRYSPRKTFCYPYLIPESFTNQINNHGRDISNENCNELSTKTIGQCSEDISSSLAMPLASTNGSTSVSINANLVNTFSDPKNGAILSNILQNFVQQNKTNSANSKSDRDENSQPITTALSDKISSETDVGLVVSAEPVCKSNEGNKNISTIGDFRGCTNSNFSNTVKTKNVQQKSTKSKNSIENLINENKGSESNMVEDRSENVYHNSKSNQSESFIEKSNQLESCVDKRNRIVDKQRNKPGNIQSGLQMNAAMEKSSKSSNLCKNTLTVTAEIHAQAFDNACNQRISGNEVKTFNGDLCQGIEIADETEMERESENISIEELEKGALMALKKLSAQISPRKGSNSLSKNAESPIKGRNSLSALESQLKGSNFVSSQASPIKGSNSLTAQTCQIKESPMKGSNLLSAQTSPMKGINCLSAQTSSTKGSNSLSAQTSPMKGINCLSAQTSSTKGSNSLSAQASPMKGSNSLSAQSSPVKGRNKLSIHASPTKGSNSLSTQSSPVKGSNTLSIHGSPTKGSNSLSLQESQMKRSNSSFNRTPCKRRIVVRSVHGNGDQLGCDAEQKEISCPVTEKCTKRGDNVRTMCNQTEPKGSPCTRMVEFVKQIEQICKNKHCQESNDMEGKQSQNDGDTIVSDKNGGSSVVRSPPYLDDLSFRNTTKYCGIWLNNDRQTEGIETIQNHKDHILNDSFCSRTSSYYDNMKRYKSWKTQSVDSEKINSNHRNHVCDLEERAVILNNNHDSDEVIQNAINNQDALLSCELNEDGQIEQNNDTSNLPTLVCSELDSKMQENRKIAQNFTQCSRDKNINEENTTVTQNFERPLSDLCEVENMQDNDFENDENCYHTETDIFTDGSIEQSPRMTQIVDQSHKEAFIRYRQLHYEDSILRDETLDHDASLSNFSSTEKSKNQQLFKTYERKIFGDDTSQVAMQTVNDDLEQITLIDEKGDNFECLQKLKQKKGDNFESLQNLYRGDNSKPTFAEFSKNTQNKSSIAKNLFKNFYKLRNSESDTNCNVYAEIMKLPKNKNQYEVLYETTSTDDSDESDQGGELLHRKRIDHKTLLLKCSRLCSYLENMERIKYQKRLLKCSAKDKVCKVQRESKKLKSKESSICKSVANDKNMNKGKSFKASSKDTKNKKGNSHGLIKDHGNLQSQNCKKRKTELQDLHDGSSEEKCRKVCNSKRDDEKQDIELQREKDSKRKLASADDKFKISNNNIIKEKCCSVKKKKGLEQKQHTQSRKSPRKRFVNRLEKTENLTQRKERINCVVSQKKASQKQTLSKLSKTETSDSCLISVPKSPTKSPAKLILKETGANISRKSQRKTVSSLKVICLSEKETSLKKGPRKTVTPSKVVCLSKEVVSPRKSPRKNVSPSEVICLSKEEISSRKSPQNSVSCSQDVCMSKDEMITRESPRKKVSPLKAIFSSKGEIIRSNSPRKTVSNLKVVYLSKDEISPRKSPRKTVSPLKAMSSSKDKISTRKSPRKTVSPLKAISSSTKGKIRTRKSPRKLTCKINCVMDCCSAGVVDKKVDNTSKSLKKKLSFDKNKKEEKQTTTDKNKTKMTITLEGSNGSVKISRKETKDNEKKGGNNEKTEKDKLKVKLFNNMSGKERMARVTKQGRKKEVKNLCVPTAAKNRKNGVEICESKKTIESASLDRSKTDFSLPKQQTDKHKNKRVDIFANKSRKKLKISSVKSVQDFPPNEVPCFKTPEKVLDLNETPAVCVQSAEKMTPKKRWKALFHSQTNEKNYVESIVDSKNNQSKSKIDQINQSVSSIVEESGKSGTSTCVVDENNQSESNFDKNHQSVSCKVEEIGQSEFSTADKSNQSECITGNMILDKCTESETCQDKTFVLISQTSCSELVETQIITYPENISQNRDSLSFIHSDITEKNSHAELIVFDEWNQTEPCVDIINQSESCVDKNNLLESCVKRCNQSESCDNKSNQLEPCVKRSNHSESFDNKSNHSESFDNKSNQLEPCVKRSNQSESCVKTSNQLESSVAKVNQFESSAAKINQSELSIDKSNQLELGSLTMLPSIEIEKSEHCIHESDDECDSDCDESWLGASFSCARFIQYTQVRNSTRTLPYIEQMRL